MVSVKSTFDINKTRKLAQFGSLSKEYDFEWPSRSEDIEPSKDGTPVRIVSISYKASQAIMLGGIRIELSNGQQRDFLAHGVDGGNLNRLVFDYPVRSVFGDQPGNGAVSNLFFMNREKEKQTSINLYPAWKSYTPEQVIGEKE